MGPYTSATAVQNCAAGPTGTPGDAGFYETTCSNPGTTNNSQFVKASDCSTASASAFPWISTVCSEPVNDSAYADPVTCIEDPGTSFPFLKVSCTTVQTMPPTFVDPLTCPLGDTTASDSGHIVTHCNKSPVSLGDFPPGTCPVDPDPLVVTICGQVFFDQYVPFCTVGSTGTDGVDDWVCTQPVGANECGHASVGSAAHRTGRWTCPIT